MLIRYVGKHDVIEIAATGEDVERGATVEVDDELGASLCEQTDSWTAVKAKPSPKTPDPEPQEG